MFTLSALVKTVTDQDIYVYYNKNYNSSSLCKNYNICGIWVQYARLS